MAEFCVACLGVVRAVVGTVQGALLLGACVSVLVVDDHLFFGTIAWFVALCAVQAALAIAAMIIIKIGGLE